MIESIIASPEVVHYICKRFDIKMSKKLGQNFLIKRGIVDEINLPRKLLDTKHFKKSSLMELIKLWIYRVFN